MQLQLVFGIGSICLLAVSVQLSSGVPAKERGFHPHQHSPSRKSQQQQIPNCDEPGHRFHSETERCYPIHQPGPCSENMMVVEDQRSGMATCVCIDRIGCHYWPFTYSEEANQCFPLYQKGHCNENEWLVSVHAHSRNNNNHNHHRNHQGSSPMMRIEGICKLRECPNDGAAMLFQHKGSCYQMDTKGFCPPGEKLYFPQGSAEPKCGNQRQRVKAGTELCSQSSPHNPNPNDSERPFSQVAPDDGLYGPSTNGKHGSRPNNNQHQNPNQYQNEEGQIPVPIQIIQHPGPIIVSNSGRPQKVQNIPVSNIPPSQSTLIMPGPAPLSIPIEIQNSNSYPDPNPNPVPTSAVNPIPIQQYSQIPNSGPIQLASTTMMSSDIIDQPDQRFLSKSGALPCADGTKRGPDGRCGTVVNFF